MQSYNYPCLEAKYQLLSLANLMLWLLSVTLNSAFPQMTALALILAGVGN